MLGFILFVLPAYIANAVPVILGGGTPLDFKRKCKLDGRRFFGDSKTLRGFIAGVSGGTVSAGILTFFYPLPFFPDGKTQFIAGFALALGTMVGDALGSFIKRRMKVEAGKPFLLDNIFFLVIALIFAYPFTSSEVYQPLPIAFLLILTFILHPLTNFLANRFGLKKVPW